MNKSDEQILRETIGIVKAAENLVRVFKSIYGTNILAMPKHCRALVEAVDRLKSDRT